MTSPPKSLPPRTEIAADFSQEATSRVVLRETLTQPVTLLATTACVLGGAATLLFDFNLVTGIAVLGGLSLAAGSWGVNYFVRGKTYADRYVSKLYAALQSQRQEMLVRLNDSLHHLKPVAGASTAAEIAGEQLRMVQERFKTVEELLGEKLSKNELTYSRYLGTAEQVYLSVLDNLLTISTLFKSAGLIDEARSRERLAALTALPQPSASEQEEAEALKVRLALLGEQIGTIKALAARNERAMTSLDLAAKAIAEMKTRDAASSTTATAIKDLEDLAKRAGQYSS